MSSKHGGFQAPAFCFSCFGGLDGLVLRARHAGQSVGSTHGSSLPDDPFSANLSYPTKLTETEEILVQGPPPLS